MNHFHKFIIGCFILTTVHSTQAAEPTTCDANNGLRLISQTIPPMQQIKGILEDCDKKNKQDVQVELLHGLVAREEGKVSHDYKMAIDWLQKASHAATPDYVIPALELAVTYEWAGQIDKASSIYQSVLTRYPDSRPALLGSARVALAKMNFDTSIQIYQQFLKKNENDIDALNGLARVYLAKKQLPLAKSLFTKVLSKDPNNADAKIGLQQITAATKVIIKKTNKIPACQVDEGLRLLNETHPAYSKINLILQKCDKVMPNDAQVLLLHGLLARKQGLANQNYDAAIMWLQKAVRAAKADNFSPSLELAVTYEWAGQSGKAQSIYNQILSSHPNNRPALLGLARTYREQYRIHDSKCIYQWLLQKDPNDIEAQVGLALTKLTNNELESADKDFKRVLLTHPSNTDAKIGLEQSKNVKRYVLSVIGGEYTLSGIYSVTGNINYSAYLNATDQFLLQLAHNSKELQLGVVLDPTLLPKNSVFLGFQRQIPNQYGWGVNYEYRERPEFRVEHRLGANANLYLTKNLQWLIGARRGLPSPWNNALYYSSLTLFTEMPVNFSVTGYWGVQQVGGGNSAYSFDLSKEFATSAFYDIGTAYSPSEHNWDVHGRFILPIFRNQGVEGGYQHYFFNGLSIYALGWRITW